jgi:hypothetical protein
MAQEHVSNRESSALDDNIGTVNLNDVRGPAPNAFVNVPPNMNLLHHFNFGQPDPSNPSTSTSNNNFLSPDLNSLHRSKSDSGSRPGHQRQSRSEDIRSPSSTFLFPWNNQPEFIDRHFLHPHPQQEAVPAIRGRHHRRASSGSRGPYTGAGGSWSNSSSQRPSPYPSPNPSPHPRYDELPNVALSGRHLLDTDTGLESLLLQDQRTGRSGGGGGGSGGGGGTSAVGGERVGLATGNGSSTVATSTIVVSKPNVTTGRTANASHKRRKQEATFSCPVPNCGSTFTRHFNLKGRPLLLFFVLFGG